MLLLGKVALVTGASRGIGKTITTVFLEQGAHVYANARREGSLDSLVDGVKNLKNRALLHPLYFDVRDGDAVKNAILEIKRTSGRLDILVNNAGIMQDALLGMIAQKSLKDIFDTNVFAMVHLMQMASKLMLRNRNGSIINISSIVGLRGSRGQVAYSASKGAVAALTRSASHELSPHGIRVNAVAPGYIDTEMFNSVAEDKRQALLARVGLGRIGTPRDVANACLFLASDLSSYISGQIIGVDGDVI